MKKIFSILISFLFLALPVKADEGMWLLHLLQQENLEDMQAMGLELTAEDIYSINHSSLKDAVGALDGGSCTAELVSPEGLLLTNHHCGYDEIQNHSSVEHNYLKNGFWAMSKEEELPNEGKTVSFVVRIEEVTEKVLKSLDPTLRGEERAQELEKITSEIVSEATNDTHYDAFVRGFFNGNRYILFVNEVYRDVRLVGAPPESIGKFGHDTDNWMWPRHTGDFSMFRVYTGPDGKPADYSPDNIPLESKHFLPVSLKGYQKDDYAMVMGFPGSTDRYMTSSQINELLEVTHPNRIKIRGIKQDIMMKDMKTSEKLNIMYASKYARSSNYWKYSIGQSQGLERLKVTDRKEKLEKEFTTWLGQTPERKAKYGEALELINAGVEARKDLKASSQYLIECMYSGMETVQVGNMLRFLYQELTSEEKDPEKIDMITSYIRNNIAEFYDEYNMETDKKVSKAMLQLILEDVKPEYQPDVIKEIKQKYNGDVDKYLSKYFKKSMLPHKDQVLAFLDNPDAKAIRKDMGMKMALSFFNAYMIIDQQITPFDEKIAEGSRLWMAGIMEMQSDKTFYPDANSTLRLTYGTVGDYYPRDAVKYSYYTTLKGVMEKENPDDDEFIVSPKLKELYKLADYGQYGENGDLHVCFTTNNDITGGNSGSPVMNSKGELIGIAFDGNWEAMSGDVAFETELQKCINVDIRYVLFVIDKYANARHLIDEMTLVQ